MKPTTRKLLLPGSIKKKESDKVACWEISIFLGLGANESRTDIWLPKSQTEDGPNGTVLVSEWILTKKKEELSDQNKTDVLILVEEATDKPTKAPEPIQPEPATYEAPDDDIPF